MGISDWRAKRHMKQPEHGVLRVSGFHHAHSSSSGRITGVITAPGIPDTPVEHKADDHDRWITVYLDDDLRDHGPGRPARNLSGDRGQDAGGGEDVRQARRQGSEPDDQPGPRSGLRPAVRPTLRPAVRPTLRPAVRPTLRPAVRPTLRPA